ncbi:MAG: ribosomal protein S18-alanine N-acetyltransferase [Pseudomonadota bacterium]
MSAVIKEADILIRPMQEIDLAYVMEIEKSAYDFPWNESIFQNCMNVGYCCWVLEHENVVVAHGVMTVAAGESHILNICVHKDYQSMGLGRKLLTHLLDLALDHDVNMTFLEVRPTNFAAIKLYLDMGFDEIGTRRNYYPGRVGREDALIFARTVVRDSDGE